MHAEEHPYIFKDPTDPAEMDTFLRSKSAPVHLRLCETAEQYGVQMHYFQIGNGFEVPAVIDYLREILDRGHVIDTHTHTYTHVPPISEETATC